MREIPESDWKLLRKLHPLALDRFCERVLADVRAAESSDERTLHERYLAVAGVIKRRDDELADIFDDMRRSRALLRLACMRSNQLIYDEEFARFSAATRESVDVMLDLRSQ